MHVAFHILCEYSEENTRFFKTSGRDIWAIKEKIDTEYRLWAHLSCHPCIRNNIMLNFTVQSLEKQQLNCKVFNLI